MKLETQMCIARNIRILRAHQAISQVRMAVDLGMTKELFAGYEQGKRTHDAEFLYKLALRYNIKMDALFEKDAQVFMTLIADKEYADDHLATLIDTYLKLTAFSRGMLLEKAMQLLERDKEIARNRAALQARLQQK